MAGVAVLAFAALGARSVALAGFGLDSLIEIGASIVVLWELGDVEDRRRRRALTLIAVAFGMLGLYVAVQSSIVLILGIHASPSPLGIAWTSATAAVMFALAWGKLHIGNASSNDVLRAEGRVTLVDGLLASAVLIGLVLNSALGWWWGDPLAAFVLVGYAIKELQGVRTMRASPPKARAAMHRR